VKTLLLLLTLLACSPASAAERILALSPHACEILYAIGAGPDIVGAVDYCDYPEPATHLPRVGSYTGINLEAALRLKPTMAVISGASTQRGQFKALGIRVVRSAPQSVEDVLMDIRRLGGLTGHARQANALADNMQQRLDRLANIKQGQPERVFYEIWSDPLQTVGGTGFINDLLQRAGLINVFASIPLETPRINIEAVLHARPDVIIIPSEHRDVAARKRFWKQWLGADIRVIVVNPDLMHRPGPRLIDGLELLQKKLQGSIE